MGTLRIFWGIVKRWIVKRVGRITEVRGTATEGGGGSGGWGSKAETGIGLFAGPSGFIENGTVDFRDNDIVIPARVESGGRTEGEGVKFRLRKKAEINGWD